MKKKKILDWGLKLFLLVFLFSIVLFPVSPSVSLDPKGNPHYKIENLYSQPDIKELTLHGIQMNEELNSETISSVAAASLVAPPVITPIELY